ncbi:MAG: ASKHA domain-containing protein [Desulfobulbaceae bacterium]|nr:ASKHA domain-containing protein [Desulfobulbaceae bacterium]
MNHLTPFVQAISIKAPEPGLHDNTADIDRLKKAILPHLPINYAKTHQLRVEYRNIDQLGNKFRQSNFQGSAIINILPSHLELTDFLCKKPDQLPAVALDLGTTHLEACLIDLLSGKEMAHDHIENSQIDYGADILSRIHFACRRDEIQKESGRPEGLRTLQQTIISTINELTHNLAHKGNCRTEDIRAFTVSGNTTMVHLFLGINPYHICREPYIPLINAPDPVRASELGLGIHPDGIVWILPSIGSYFGGDLISGIIASGLDEAEKPAMLIDVGTNAEVVIGSSDFLIACAGAAGPALEGDVARMGMRAAPGAVERVRIDPTSRQLTYSTIDQAPAVGICGSGMIDLVAELYLSQLIDLRGKFRTSNNSAFAERFFQRNNETHFIVVKAKDAANNEPVTLSQIDLDAMMRSKAAMYAILTTLINQVGMEFSELERIHVAGAFGKHINPRQAIVLGMLPDLPLETFAPIGNSSLQGAKLILLDEKARQRSLEIANKITYIELNVNQEFMIRFSGSRFIPHTDPHLFPSVPIFHG